MSTSLNTLIVDILKSNNIASILSTDAIDISGFHFSNDESMLPQDEPLFKIANGKSELVINEISNRGNDIKINGLVITGSPTIQLDVNQENINVTNINAFNTDYVFLKDKPVIHDGIIRFKGLGIDTDTNYNQTVIAERSYDVNKYELLLFKGNKANNRIALDASESIVFMTDNSSERLYHNPGVTRMTISNTDIIMELELKVDIINEQGTDNGVTVEGILLKDSSISSLINLSSSGYISVNTISEYTLDSGVTIEGNLLKDSNIEIPNYLKVDTINDYNPGSGVTIETILIKGGDVNVPGQLTVATLSLDTMTERSFNQGVTIENVLLKQGTIYSGQVNTDNIEVDTIVEKTLNNGVVIENIQLKDGNAFFNNPLGEVRCHNIYLTGSIQTDGIFEYTLDNGVYVDSVYCKDGKAYQNDSSDPTIDCQFAIKKYVDDSMSGNVSDWKESVICVTTGNIDLTTGGLNPGGTDGIITLSDCDKILVRTQLDPAENGIYNVHPGSWTRSPNQDVFDRFPGAVVVAETGTSYADSIWLCTTDRGGTLGITPITWQQLPSTNLHNDLAGIQGGTIGQYYHLTQAEHTELTTWMNDPQVTLSSAGNTNIGSGTLIAGKLVSTELEFAGDITIDTESASNQTVTITNSGAGNTSLQVNTINGESGIGSGVNIEDMEIKKDTGPTPDEVRFDIPTGHEYVFYINNVEVMRLTS